MIKPIYIKSPRNGRRVLIGETDISTKTAYFNISEARHFQEAESIGVDVNVFNRKAIQQCEQIMFQLWDNRKFRISRQDFARHSWIYPPGGSPEYKAAAPDFVPKMMITIENAKKLNNWTKEAEIEEMSKRGVFG